jgi:DNA-binding IclR family transcriptional regulator
MPKPVIKRAIQHPSLRRDRLELFAHTPGSLTVSEVARHLNRAVAEISRMLLCLGQHQLYMARQSPD